MDMLYVGEIEILSAIENFELMFQQILKRLRRD